MLRSRAFFVLLRSGSTTLDSAAYSSDLYSGGTGAGGLSDHRPHGVRGERGHILRDAYNNKWGFNILQNVHGTLLWFAVELD